MWQAKVEGCSSQRIAFKPNIAAMGFSNLLGNCQSDACSGSAVSRFGRAIEPLKDSLSFFWKDVRAKVMNAE
jgi:hypothetical protein